MRDQLPDFFQVQSADLVVDRLLAFIQDFLSGLLVFIRTDEDDLDIRPPGEKVDEPYPVADSPVAELVPSADVDGDDLESLESVVFPEFFDFCGLIFLDRGKAQRRKRFDVHSQCPDKIDVVLHTVEVTLFRIARDFEVIYEIPVFDPVPDLQSGFG